jgi:restriction system protein
MTRRKKNKLIEEVIEFFYSASVVLAIWVWLKTGKLWLAALTFGVSLGLLFFGIENYKQRKRKILFESGIDTIDNMSGVVFEKYLLEHFKHLGYSGHLTPSTADYGADLVLQKDGRRVVVQAKRWKNSVGVDAIQQVIGAIKHYDANKGMVVTNSTFTENAYELANSNGIELWDRKKLIEVMNKAKGKEIINNIVKDKVISEAAITEEKICPECKQAMVVRSGKHGKFWGCTGFPKCKYTAKY